jgi:2,4-dichlorophenol 6-monooxygenase
MGMNTGIQDAHNLVWKLGALEAGRAGAALLDTYESERRPVAQRNADQSLANALRMLESLGELGLDGDVPASRARLAALQSTAEGRERIRRTIDAQQEHFDMFGLQLGFSYEVGAVVPDGTLAPVVENAVRDLVQTARPGHRMPHAWIERDGARRSSLDLLAGDTFTLIAGPDGGAWDEAVRRAGVMPLSVVVAGRDFGDPGEGWRRACGIERDGALLVRPDQHVAWRAPGMRPDRVAALAAAVTAVLEPSPAGGS